MFQFKNEYQGTRVSDCMPVQNMDFKIPEYSNITDDACVFTDNNQTTEQLFQF